MSGNYVALAIALSLAGCSFNDTLYVGTYTRVGIDASKDGAGGGIGVKNVALTVSPTTAKGEAYNVLGTTDVDLSYSNLLLSETLATGEAAECASGERSAENLIKTLDADKTPAGPLVFAAVTSWSLLEVQLGEATGPSISFGYRRAVGIRMPIKEEKIGSAYASVSISTVDKNSPSTLDKSEIGGTRSVYTFATGPTSVRMAKKYAAKLTADSDNKGCQ